MTPHGESAGDAPMRTFDLAGPLPGGTTVLEASAGTGKTHTISALATRYVAEGVADLSDLLVVTFGRAATSELRDRVRETMLRTRDALRRPAAARSADPVVRLLATGGSAGGDAAARLSRALAQFDAATITTTHGFCQQMLASLGLLADADADATFLPDVADLERAVVDDLYVRRYSGEPQPPLSVGTARTLARKAVSDHHAVVVPEAPEQGSEPWHRVALAREARAELLRRKRVGRLMDYDDLLVLLRDALVDPVHGAAAAARLRATYRVVMVDEFQDTDPVQWDILRTAFHGHATLVLIGDPKQAIYKFRGADVVTYLQARAAAGETATLGTNWRSDAALVSGISTILGGAALGSRDIAVHPVDSHHASPRIRGTAPVRLRHVTQRAVGASGEKPVAVGTARAFVVRDVADDVVRVLESDDVQVLDGVWRKVRPGDIAVVCRRNADAAAVLSELAERAVPAVQSALSSVFRTPAARDWVTFLMALEQPWSSGRAAAAALCPFVGWTATRLGTATESELEQLSERLAGWAAVLTRLGVAGLVDAVDAAGLAERLLAQTRGERALVDLRHVGQALHHAATAGGLGTNALVAWLRERIEEAETDFADERSRRLETDADAVQVITVHASKGLQFPIVYVPFAWERWMEENPDPLSYHDPDGTRLLDVGGRAAPEHAARKAMHHAEESGEDLRLFYVSATRARSLCVLWWAHARPTRTGALTRLLLGTPDEDGVPAPPVAVPQEAKVAESFQDLAARSNGTVAVERVDGLGAAVRWSPPARVPPPLAVARLDRGFDARWRRTSYTALTADAHAQAAPGAVTAEPESDAVTDEAEAPFARDAAALDPASVSPSPGSPSPAGPSPAGLSPGSASPMAALPGGTAFGTVVHHVLEHADTAAPDLGAELLERCREALATRLPGVSPTGLAAALQLVLHTPLGPLAGGATLRDIPPRDRLAELEFELPLAGGDSPRGRAPTLRAVADAVARHLDPADPFAAYAPRLAQATAAGAGVRGYLTGSLDAVLRVPVAGTTRYVVVDYKTNRLAPAGVDLTLAHYRPAALAEAMMAAHYPLQLLLYTVALHRFLRWRLPGYDPDEHLGGGLYLFVRGMAGPSTPVLDGSPCGVLGWRPPTALVLDLSAVLDGRGGPAGPVSAGGAGGAGGARNSEPAGGAR